MARGTCTAGTRHTTQVRAPKREGGKNFLSLDQGSEGEGDERPRQGRAASEWWLVDAAGSRRANAAPEEQQQEEEGSTSKKREGSLLPGFEPGTLRLTVACSNQLSHRSLASRSAEPTQLFLSLPGTSLKNVTSSNTRIETSSPMIERSSDNNNKHSQTSTTPHQQTPRERESVVERVSVCCTTDASPTLSLSPTCP